MIVYFSGSGNSLVAARQIAEKTGDKVMHLNEAADADMSGEEVVGLVYPAYSWDAPLIVKSILPRLNINAGAYVYIVVTCGSTPGNAVPTVVSLLAEKGVKVSYSRILSVPDSSAICFGNNANDQFKKFDVVPSVIEAVADDVRARRKSLAYEKRTIQANFINSRFFFPVATWLVRQYVNEAKCIGCGICAEVCPCKNIVVEDGKASPGKNCTQCLACVHFCPKQAMEIRHKTMPKQLQYHHPDIKAKDMMGVGRKWVKEN